LATRASLDGPDGETPESRTTQALFPHVQLYNSPLEATAAPRRPTDFPQVHGAGVACAAALDCDMALNVNSPITTTATAIHTQTVSFLMVCTSPARRFRRHCENLAGIR